MRSSKKKVRGRKLLTITLEIPELTGKGENWPEGPDLNFALAN